MPLKRKHDPGYKLPEVIDPDTCCVCIPIPNDFNHKMAFLGQLDELGYWWNWERDPDRKGREAAAIWRTIVSCIREDLNMSDCGCGDDKPTNTRINPETGLYEVSYDGGVTWQPEPNSDPRSSGTIFPPTPGVPGAAKRCEGANSVVGFFQELQQEEHAGLVANSSVAEFITVLIGGLAAIGIAFAFVPSAIAALLAFVVNTFARKIPEDFEAEFTETTWDDLHCVLYCHMSPDGSFTEGAWQSVKNEAIDTVGGYAGYWLHDHINLIGVVGLTNAARASYAGTRECDECDCDTPCVDESNIMVGQFVSKTENEITITSILTTYNGITAYWAVYGSDVADYCCYYCSFELISGSIDSGGAVDCDGVAVGTPHIIRRIEFYKIGAPYTIKLKFDLVGTECE